MRIIGILMIVMGLFSVVAMALFADIGMAIHNFYFSTEGPFGSEFPNEPVGYWETFLSPWLAIPGALVVTGLVLLRSTRVET